MAVKTVSHSSLLPSSSDTAGTVLLHLFAAVLYARHNYTNGHGVSHNTLPSPSGHASSEHPPRRKSTLTYLNAPAAPPPPLPQNVHVELKHQKSATHLPPSHEVPYPPIRSVYFTAPNPFPAMEEFVIASAERYALDLWRFGGGMKAALEEYLSCTGGKEIRAILLGTRQGDPNGSECLSQLNQSCNTLPLKCYGLELARPRLELADPRRRSPSTNRPVLAASPARPPRPRLDIPGYLAVPAGFERAILHTVR